MTRRTIAVLLAVTMLVSVAASGAIAASDGGGLSVAVEQADDGTATVTVTDNGTAVPNATVAVEPTDPNATYGGAGTYETGENGTVSLPAPDNQTVTVAVTATVDNRSATTTVELAPVLRDRATFGQSVSAFVTSLDRNATDGPIGLVIASFVTGNNPGNAAGPPAWVGNETGSQGPPEHAGNSTTQGPPEHAGNSTTQGPPEHAGNSTTRGPPEHAGNSSAQGPPEDAGNDGSQGPPENRGKSDEAKGNGNAGARPA